MSEMSHEILPITDCELCRHWQPEDCARDLIWWPDQGDKCQEFEREPGVEG